MIAEEARLRHERGFPPRGPIGHTSLPAGGQYQWRARRRAPPVQPRDGPQAAARLPHRRLPALQGVHARWSTTRRSSLVHAARPAGLQARAAPPVPHRRGRAGRGDRAGASRPAPCRYGSISKEAHETLAIAMNRIGGKSQHRRRRRGPGALRAATPNGDSRSSAIKQVASGRFGVTSEYLVNADELQIKMAQGAKPGEGGQLPGHKVYPWIAKVRHSTPGVGLISPPPHHDIYSIEDLAAAHPRPEERQPPRARISVKLVAEVGVGTIAAGVAKAHADVVLISGHDGGTGASPLTSHQARRHALGARPGRDAPGAGAERPAQPHRASRWTASSRPAATSSSARCSAPRSSASPPRRWSSLGCVMMRVCHLNTCPVGVATQDPKLRANASPASPSTSSTSCASWPRRCASIMAQLGFRTHRRDGRPRPSCSRCAARSTTGRRAASTSRRILYKPDGARGATAAPARSRRTTASTGRSTRRRCSTLARAGHRARRSRSRATLPIRNTNRVVGTMTGSEVTRRHGAAGLPDGHDPAHTSRARPGQ